MIAVYVFGLIIFICFGVVVFRGAPYVPSHRKDVVKAITELYPLGKNDVLLDVGSGDGIILRLASKRGARAIGFEINPILVFVSRILSLHDKKIIVKLTDFWLAQVPDETTVIYAFVVTRDVGRLTKKIQKETNRIGRKISVISYGNAFSSINTVKSSGAYHLYEFRPLQQGKAQV